MNFFSMDCVLEEVTMTLLSNGTNRKIELAETLGERPFRVSIEDSNKTNNLGLVSYSFNKEDEARVKWLELITKSKNTGYISPTA